MNKIQRRRLVTITILAVGISIATGFILYALKQNINVFLTPTQLATSYVSTDYRLRLGGVVKPGSIIRAEKGLGVQFVVTDFKHNIIVNYVGVLPDLFRENKGVIVEGNLNQQGQFIASTVLAKHDENYMPKNVYEALRKNTT